MSERKLRPIMQVRRRQVDLSPPTQGSLESLADEKRQFRESLLLQETSEQYKEWVLWADQLIEVEMRRFNVEPEILEGRDAFFSEAEVMSPHERTVALHQPFVDATIFRPDAMQREMGDSTILRRTNIIHERIHHHSFASFDFLHSEDTAIAVKGRFALGVNARMDTDDFTNYFTPIFEAVTEEMAMDLMLQQCDADPELKQLADDDNIFSERVNRASEVYTPGSDIVEQDFYITYVQIMNLIYKAISDVQGESVSDIKDRWRRSLFTGEMMHMRDVERVFGPGSLRFLGALGLGFKKGVSAADQAIVVGEYFLTQDHTVHEQLARQFLKEDELQRWLAANTKNNY
jgi:hypothetical protein